MRVKFGQPVSGELLTKVLAVNRKISVGVSYKPTFGNVP